MPFLVLYSHDWRRILQVADSNEGSPASVFNLDSEQSNRVHGVDFWWISVV